MSIEPIFVRGVGTLKHAFRAFRNPNFRLFFVGQGVSLVGTWMQSTALGWLVYRMTGSRALLGLVAFGSQIPSTFLTPFTGALSDRVSRRPILIASQTVAMLQAAILTTLVTLNIVEPWHIVALALLAGLTVAFDVPVRQSFVVEMLEDKADLQNALALNSVMFNSARFIGPAVAGVAIYYWGEAPMFGFNALSYLAVIAVYFAMKPKRHAPPARGGHFFADFRDGILYAWRHPVLRAALGLLAFFAFVIMPYMTLIPAVARDVLGGDSTTNGNLLACVGAGAIAAAAFLATRTNPRLRGMTLLGAGGMSLSLMAFSFARAEWLALPLMALVGFFSMLFSGATNQLIQTAVHDDKRGRVMGLYSWCFIGVAPFGALTVGALAEHDLLGVPWTLFACGAAALLAALLAAHGLFRRNSHGNNVTNG